jgi:hypothetical protein
VANHIPTRLRASLGKERVAAGNIFFGMDLVEFVCSPIAFVGDGEQTNAMNGSRSSAETGEMETKFVPGKVREVEEREHYKHAKYEATPGKSTICGKNCRRGHSRLPEIVPDKNGQLNQGRHRQNTPLQALSQGSIRQPIRACQHTR